MVYLLKGFAESPARPVPPQRRRTIIIGGGPTGISAAYHLGEHSLLLERRVTLEESNDHSHDLALGVARGGPVGSQDVGTDGQRPGTSVAERKALFISCGSTGESADPNKLIHLARWQPPALERDEERETDPVRALVPLLRGEVRLGANVVRVSPSKHMLELADGSRFVYDKLLSTVPVVSLATLLIHELTSQISHAEFFRHWLSELDIEVSDGPSQFGQGDVDEFAAGKRMAEYIHRMLAGRFQAKRRGSSFFEPRLVQATVTATP